MNDSFDIALSENCDLGQTGGTAVKGDKKQPKVKLVLVNKEE